MKAPTFQAETHCGTTFDSSELLKHKNLLLYFFPEIDFDNTNRVTQEAFLFKNYFVRLDLKHFDAVGITNDSRDLNKLFIQRFGIPFHLVYDRQHEIAAQFEKVMHEENMERTLVVVKKGGVIKGFFHGDKIERKLKEMVGYSILPWYKKILKKPL